jgi:hypothetical protein
VVPALSDDGDRNSANRSAINSDCVFPALNHIPCMSGTSARRRVQSREASLLEAATNVALGFILALSMQALLYPLFGISTTVLTDSTIAVAFTLMSLVRSYVVRRAFETFATERDLSGQRLSAAEGPG